jgi:hypothetical protein
MTTTLELIDNKTQQTYDLIDNTTEPDLSPIEKLPPEISIHIFSFLNDNSLFTLGAVSTTFRKLSSEDQLWKKYSWVQGGHKSLKLISGPQKIRDSYIQFSQLRKIRQKENNAAIEYRRHLAQGTTKVLKSNAIPMTEKIFYLLFAKRKVIQSLVITVMLSTLISIYQVFFSDNNKIGFAAFPILIYLISYIIYSVVSKNSKHSTELNYYMVDTLFTIPAFLLVSTLLLFVLKEDFSFELNFHIVLLPLYLLLIFSGFIIYEWLSFLNMKVK